MTIPINYKIAYAEIDEILNLLDNELVEKIPDSLRQVFKDNKSIEHKINIDINKPLEEQNLNRKTFVILSNLYLHFWCNDEKEKKEFLDSFKENDRLLSKRLEEEYDLEKRLKKNVNNGEENKVDSIVEIKEQNIIQKVISKIKQWLRIK